MYETLIPLLLYGLPIVICMTFWNQVHKFNKNKGNIKFFDVIYDEYETGIFPNQQVCELEKKLRENNTVAHHRENLIMKYRKLRIWIIVYCISIALLTILWGIFIILDLTVFHWNHHELIILAIIGAGVNNFCLGLWPIFRSLSRKNSKKVSNYIDKLMYSFFSPSGYVNNFILDVANEVFILCVITILFWAYLEVRIPIFNYFHLEHNLVSMTIFLCVYQYVVVPGVFFCFLTLLQKIFNKTMNRFGFKSLKVNSEYLKESLRNNTYLLFLLLVFITKDYQVAASSEAGITGEAIGIVYLIDTYIKNYKNCRRWKFTEP